MRSSRFLYLAKVYLRVFVKSSHRNSYKHQVRMVWKMVFGNLSVCKGILKKKTNNAALHRTSTHRNLLQCGINQAETNTRYQVCINTERNGKNDTLFFHSNCEFYRYHATWYALAVIDWPEAIAHINI